jgi:hypothetical protein
MFVSTLPGEIMIARDVRQFSFFVRNVDISCQLSGQADFRLNNRKTKSKTPAMMPASQECPVTTTNISTIMTT